jgi:hypothetical protein
MSQVIAECQANSEVAAIGGALTEEIERIHTYVRIFGDPYLPCHRHKYWIFLINQSQFSARRELPPAILLKTSGRHEHLKFE